MSEGFECLNCKHLGKCGDTDEEKLRTQYHCFKWEGAVTELVYARNVFIQKLGAAAFPVLLNTEVIPKEP